MAVSTESPKNIVAPANQLDPVFTATQGGDQAANPCHDEVITDINNQSQLVQQALRDFDCDVPVGFPPSSNLIADLTNLQRKAAEATAAGRIGDAATLANTENQLEERLQVHAN